MPGSPRRPPALIRECRVVVEVRSDKDPNGEIGRAAACDKVNGAIEVDVEPAGQEEAVRSVTANPLQAFQPAENASDELPVAAALSLVRAQRFAAARLQEVAHDRPTLACIRRFGTRGGRSMHGGALTTSRL